MAPCGVVDSLGPDLPAEAERRCLSFRDDGILPSGAL